MTIPILMSKSRNTEIDGTNTRIRGAFQNSSLGGEKNLGKIMGPLDDLSVLFSTAINRLKEVSEQKGKDDVRDERIDALEFLLKGFSHHPDATVKNAATVLLELFENYGAEIKDDSYSVESSLLNSMLADFAKPELQANIALVPQCAEYIAGLQAAQTDFEETRIGFEEARAKEGTLENASALKKKVVTIINGQLVPYLSVMVQLDKAKYGDFARTVAQIIADNNEAVKRRGKKTDD